LTKPTLGAANVSVPVGNVSGLRINEWLACLEARFSNDFIELANAGDKPVALGGVGVTGDYLKVPDAHRLAPLSFIGPQSYLLLESLGKRSVRRYACDLPFRLPSHHGWIRLVGANGTEIDKVHYVCQRPDIAQGRLPNSSDNMVYLTVPTPGAANGAAKEVSSLVRGLLLGLRISEIMYHPQNADLEFIELTNTGSETLSLTGVRFTAGIEFVFTDGTLEPGACVVLANNPEAFGAHYGKAVSVAGTYSGKLSNGGETLELSLPKPANMAIQRFKYNDKWYSETDGGGRSLTIIDLQADVKLWDDLINWRPCDAEGGSPGTL
ncbi:MAG: lamin tail domain-containing protein, partial [Verrucomicrobiales bacterium]